MAHEAFYAKGYFDDISSHTSDHVIDLFKRVHDLRLVWTPEIRQQATDDRDPRQLGHRLF